MSNVKCYIFDPNQKIRYDQSSYRKEDWVSYERGVKVGDVRVFNENLYVAWSVEKRKWPRKHTIRWQPIKKYHLKHVFATIGEE